MKECQPTSCWYERKERAVKERYRHADSQMTMRFQPGARMEKLTFLDQVRQSSHAAFPREPLSPRCPPPPTPLLLNERHFSTP